MIPRANEAFQEWLPTSWYGEINKTQCLRRERGVRVEGNRVRIVLLCESTPERT